MHESSIVSVLGPRGKARVDPPASDDSVWAAVAASGSLILGISEHVEQLAAILQDPRMSRTVSYLASIVSDAGTLLRGLERIRSATVTVVGCGGIGSLLCVLLAGAGVANLRAIDPDLVEQSNLNRQLMFTNADLGRRKVDVLTEAIRARFPDVGVVGIHERMGMEFARDRELLRETTGPIAVTADEPIGIIDHIRAAVGADVRHVYSSGYRFSEGVVALMKPALGGAAELAAETGESEWASLEHGMAPSFGPQNAQIAAVLASRLLLEVGQFRVPANQLLAWDTSFAAH